MSNPTLKDLFGALQNEMAAKAQASLVVAHPCDKGENTEVNWLSWFSEYLPNRYKAAKASIIDSKGNISDQIDIVIYDRQYSNPAFNQNGILYLPAESVYAVFEVKQTMSKQHMEYAGKKAESVRSLYRTSASIPHAGGVYPPKALHRITAGILTTTSDWKPPFDDPFKACLKSFTEQQQLDCGCVLQSGSFSFDCETKMLKTSAANESLVSFFLQLLTTLQKMGTVPAIDFSEYMNALSITEEQNG